MCVVRVDGGLHWDGGCARVNVDVAVVQVSKLLMSRVICQTNWNTSLPCGGSCCHHVDLDLSIVNVAGPSHHSGVEPNEHHGAHVGALLTTVHLATQLQFRCGRRVLPDREAWP